MGRLLVSPIYSESTDNPYDPLRKRREEYRERVNRLIADIRAPYVTKTPKKITKRRLRRMGVTVK